MAMLWNALQTLMVLLGLIFAIVSLSTESWSAISFDVKSPSTCVKGNLCFVVPVSVGSNETEAFETAVRIGIFNATDVLVPGYGLLSEPTDAQNMGEVQQVIIFGGSTVTAMQLQHIANIVYSEELVISYGGVAYTAGLPPAPAPMAINIDFGLVNECFSYGFPLPAFSTPLNTRICFSKTDICTMVDSKEMSSYAERADAKDVQGDISTVCKKMTATVALCAFVVVTLTLVALVVVFPTVRRFSCHLATPQLQAGLIAVAVVVSLCAVAVWGSVVEDAKSMEKHLQDQIQRTEIGQLLTEEMPQNFSSKLSYSFYLQLCTLLCSVAALLITIFGGIRKNECLSRPFPRKSVQAKLEALHSGDDDDEDDDHLINTL